MKLSELLKTVTVKRAIVLITENSMQTQKIEKKDQLRLDPEIASIHYKAQDVKPSGLFVAIPGLTTDGHHFIDEAFLKGASTIVCQKSAGLPRMNHRDGYEVKKDSIIIEVENTRKALAAISSRFYGNPSESLFIIGITGTNGKTTTAFLIESILKKADLNVGVIGTINYHYSGKTYKNPMTTPESLDLQRILADMLKKGITHVVMEASSHGIDLFRIDNCRIDIGVFTNLSQDHLDYHKDMNSYWECKKRLFTENLNSGPKKGRTAAVINCDDAKGKELLSLLTISSLTTGYSNNNMIWPKHFKIDMAGIVGKISTPDGDFEFKSSIVGKHNLENILSATGVGFALNIPLKAIKDGIEEISSIPGRLESIANDSDKFIYVDYAHTPDALENVLNSLKSLTSNRIICVFGCGGDRDKEKRPQMGEIAGRLCDLAIITSDNPRTEMPMEIISRIIQGTIKVSSHEYTPLELATGFNKKGYVVEQDRRKAIRLAIKVSQPGDIVLIAGKGHEDYQIIGNKTVSFDDRDEVRQALSLEAISSRRTATNH